MNNKDNKNFNSNNNLDEMMKNATQKVEYEGEDNNSEKKPSKKVVIFSIVGTLLFIGILAVGAIMIQKPQDFEDKTKTPGWVDEQKGLKESKNKGYDYDFSDVEQPIKLREWAQNPYNKNSFWNKDGIEEELLKISKEEYKNFYFSIFWMPSGIDHGHKDETLAGPYTNDVSKQFENGKPNPNFSYTLAEDYEKAYVIYTERLLNPMFGNWSSTQSYGDYKVPTKENGKFNELRDMFSSKWWNENIDEYKDYSNLPVLVEWEKDNWSQYNLAKRDVDIYGVFYGQVNETENNLITVEILGVDELFEQPIIKVKTPVKYSAFKENGSLAEIEGTLELTLQANENSLDSNNRIIISNARLHVQ